MTTNRNPQESMRWQARQRLCQRGFTLVELIMVIVILGVLAVYATASLNTSDFFARGFHDETLGLLRYAQKTAIAQRRTVCVAFSAPSPASATLTIASAPASFTCNTSLTGPNQSCSTPTGPTGCIHARPGISYVGTPASFYFDGLGQPSGRQTMTVANAGTPISLTITIEAATGYVHD